MKRQIIAGIAVLLVLVHASSFTAQADLIYGVGNNFVSIVDFQDMPLSAKLFDTPGQIWYGSTDSPDPASFYATTNDGALYKITPYNTTVSKVGDYVPGEILDIRELAYNESNNTLYGTDYSNLYTVC